MGAPSVFDPVTAAPSVGAPHVDYLPSGAEPTGQLGLFAWRPKPRLSMQLSLFGEPPDGAE